jgi:VanZ family protein
VVISVLYAISDEYHQHFVHGRHGTPIDVLIDSIGIFGIVVWESRRRR